MFRRSTSNLGELHKVFERGKKTLDEVRGEGSTATQTPRDFAEPDLTPDYDDDDVSETPESSMPCGLTSLIPGDTSTTNAEVPSTTLTKQEWEHYKKRYGSSANAPQVNADGSLRPGILPQHQAKAKPSPHAKPLSGSNQSIYKRICDEWTKIAHPDTGFQYFCRNYVWINNQKHGYVKFQLYGYQERLVDTIQNNRFVITKKFRQAGASLLTGVYCLWYSLVRPRMQCMIVSIGQRESSKYLQENVREIYEALPQWLRGGLKKYPIVNGKFDPSLIDPIKWKRIKAPKDAATEMMFPNRSKIRSVPTGKAGGRGFSTKLLVIDEAAFIEGIEQFYIGAYPTINNTGGSVFVISTVNGVGGIGSWYYQTFKGAEAGDNKFVIADMHYTEHPDYNDPEWVEDTKRNLGPRGWRQEVLGEFLASGKTYIDGDFIAEMEAKCAKPIRKEYGNKLWIWKDPVPGHHYGIGADCATRGGLDNSAFSVMDYDTGEQVAEFVGKIEENQYAKLMAEVGYRYGTAIISPELNASAGGAVCNSLDRVQRYKRIYRQQNGAPGWNTTTRTRNAMVAELEASLYDGSWKINSTRFCDELKTFIVTEKGKIEHDDGCHDDAIFGFMIATTPDVIRAGKKHRPMLPVAVTTTGEGGSGEHWEGTVKPVYSEGDQKREARKKREHMIGSTTYGAQYERAASVSEAAGEDILGFLLG